MRRILLALLAIATFIPAMAQQRATLCLNKDRLEAQTEERLRKLIWDIYGAMANGSLKMYKEAELKTPISLKDINEANKHCEEIRYDGLPDTTICTYPEPDNIFGFMAYSALSHAAKWKDVTTLALIYHRPETDITLKICYLQRADIDKWIDAPLRRLLDNALSTDNTERSGVELTMSGIRDWADSFQVRVLAPLYEASRMGNLRSFVNDSMTRIILPSKIPDIGSYQEEVQVEDTLTGNFNSLIVNVPFDIQLGNGLAVVFDAKQDKKGVHYTMTGLAPCYSPMIGGISLSAQPMFFWKIEDVKKRISPADMQLLQDLALFGSLASHDKGRYGGYFQDEER